MQNQIVKDTIAKIESAKVAKANEVNRKGSDGAPKLSYFSILFYLLVDAMQIRQGTVLTQSKVIAANSSTQDRLNKENANVKFSILPPDAKQATIDRVQELNEQYAALRQDIENALISTRQEGEVQMTQTTTNVNILEQDASENSGWLKTLNTIFQVIDEISKNK